MRLTSCLATLAPLLMAMPASAQIEIPANLADMAIEELANIQITSVSRKPEPLAGAAAAVFVITNDDIRRSGATSIPEALRLAPNLQIGMVSNGAYAISARGLNGSNNSAPNKLQVLIDGRSVYAPLFSGVFWDAQDLMLEDIERIEVISGPGGTLWGVNAVNGVINITTRAARDTSGSLAVLSAGQRGADAAFRHGGTMANGHWRVYGKHLDQRHTALADGAPVNDARHQSQVGFRADWERGSHQFSAHGNAYRGNAMQPEPGAIQTGAVLVLGPVVTSGANLTGRWTYRMAGADSLNVQAYLDHTERDVPPAFGETLDIADLQFQHMLAARAAHTFVWGANYRHTRDQVRNSDIIAFLPANTSQHWGSLFAQDDIALRENVRLVLGARVERNPYTGSEFLPTMRLAWNVALPHAVGERFAHRARAIPARCRCLYSRTTAVHPARRASHPFRGGDHVRAWLPRPAAAAPVVLDDGLP